MPEARRWIRVVIAIAALVVAVAALGGVAAGATVTSARIDGTAGTTSPSASVLPASVTADLLSGEIWRSTGVTFTGGGETVTRCVNTDDRSGGEDGSTATVSFNVTAPTPPATYDVAFTAFSGTSCT